MRLLLDSNALLWLFSGRKQLTSRVRQLLEEDQHDLFVSRASIWELSIKVKKGKLDLPGSSIQSLLDQIEETGIVVLPIEDTDILRTETLPHHHKDPFDRMIVAQALEQNLTIVTSDSDIPKYDAPVIWK